jgi:hypothetical protein
MIRKIAQQYQVKPVFVWQPVPGYRYDMSHHLFAEDGLGPHTWSTKGYPAMARYVEEHPMGNDFLWSADMQENRREPLYVDTVHYSMAMAEDLAERIVELMEQRDLLNAFRRVHAAPSS